MKATLAALLMSIVFFISGYLIAYFLFDRFNPITGTGKYFSSELLYFPLQTQSSSPSGSISKRNFQFFLK
ncbi:hypothetical protein [uncultured Chryseobacterium sp.]|uniref:hypothetical protein n=1 Tax=uncultured Chryseobacterium sp. TaxID=259322 RepID=UPI0025DEEAF2|nr:hypothetical protein [uncultured Chryseobacterium sp.]